MLTAYHVASGGERIDRDTVAAFYLGVGDEGPGVQDFDHFELSSPARAVVWGDYRGIREHDGPPLADDFDQENGWQDWALLKLDTCLGAPEFGHGYMRLRAMSTRELMRTGIGLSVRTLGFPIDKDASRLWLDPTCRVIGQIYSSGWQHDCITLPGNSGGPIVIEDGEDRLIGVNVSHIGIEGIEADRSDRLFLAGDDPTYYEYLSIGVPVAAFLDRILPYLPFDAELAEFARARREQHYAEGTEDAAIADLDLALANQPKRADLLLLRGLWEASKGDVKSALADWRRVESDPQIGPRARYHRARLLLELGVAEEVANVEKEFTALMAEFPGNLELRQYRSLARMRQENWTGAIDDLDGVLERRPQSAVAFNDRGDAWRSLRDLERARRDYDRAIELAPEWPEAWRDRGYLEHMRAGYQLAESDFLRALALNDSDAEAMNGLGLVALAMGEGARARQDFSKAMEALPQSGVYVANRGAANWVAGDFDGAIGDFEKSIALDPREPYIRLFEFVALARLGRREEATQRLQAYLEGGAPDSWPKPLMRYYLGAGSLEDIEKAVGDAPEVKLAGYQFDRDFYLGEWALIRGDRQSAIRRLRSVLESELREYLEYDLAQADYLSLGGKLAH